MKIVARIAIVIAAAVIVGWALQRFAYEPYACNRTLTNLSRRTTLAYETGNYYLRLDRARRNIPELTDFRERCPTEIRAYTLMAANEVLLGRHEDAIRTYRQAFAVDRRPELHVGIGEAQIQLGRPDEAVESFVLAARFNPDVVASIPSEEVTRRVEERLRAPR